MFASGAKKMKKGLTALCHRFFTNLANPTRLATLEKLMAKPMSVNELAVALGQEQSMISHNLKPLLECNILFVENHGKKHIYTINKNTMTPIFSAIENHARQYCPKGGKCLQEEKITP